MPKIDFRPSGDLRHDVAALTQQMVTALEHSIRHHPEQWYMFRRMWNDAQPQATGSG
jgi:lauroyl/myristoyl acyltransferase